MVDSLINFDWDRVNDELRSCPELFDVLNAVGSPGNLKHTKNQQLEKRMAVVYSLLMQARCKDLSLFQRLRTVVLTEGGASKKVNNKMF